MIDDYGHILEGWHCWCEPSIQRVCPECGEATEPDPDCWRCEGAGSVQCDEEEARAYDGSLVIVHYEDETDPDDPELGPLVKLDGDDGPEPVA